MPNITFRTLLLSVGWPLVPFILTYIGEQTDALTTGKVVTKRYRGKKKWD